MTVTTAGTLEVGKNGKPCHKDVKGREFDAMPVVVIDIDISFTQAIVLIIKFTLASIPAAILLVAIGFIVGLILSIFGVQLPHLQL